MHSFKGLFRKEKKLEISDLSIHPKKLDKKNKVTKGRDKDPRRNQ